MGNKFLLKDNKVALVFVAVLDYEAKWHINRQDKKLFYLLKNNISDLAYNKFIDYKKVNPDTIISSIKEALVSLGKKDLLIFYFAGHGVINNLSQPSMELFDGELFSTKKLKETILKYINGQKVLLLGDFCYSGGLVQVAKELSRNNISAISFTSASSNISMGTWSYTQVLIDAFSGRPIVDKNNDGKITCKELAYEIKDVMLHREFQKADSFICKGYTNMIISLTSKKFKHSKFNGIKTGKWYCSTSLGQQIRVTAIQNKKIQIESYDMNRYLYTKVGIKDLRIMQKISLPIGATIYVTTDFVNDCRKAKVISKSGILYLVKYYWLDERYNEWISKNRIVGNISAEVLWDDNNWYDAEILQTKGNKYFIKYIGEDPSTDEWIDKNRIRNIKKIKFESKFNILNMLNYFIQLLKFKIFRI